LEKVHFGDRGEGRITLNENKQTHTHTCVSCVEYESSLFDLTKFNLTVLSMLPGQGAKSSGGATYP